MKKMNRERNTAEVSSKPVEYEQFLWQKGFAFPGKHDIRCLPVNTNFGPVEVVPVESEVKTHRDGRVYTVCHPPARVYQGLQDGQYR